MTTEFLVPLRVREVEPLSPLLKSFVFEAADGGPVHPAGAGAHLRLLLQNRHQRWKNAYSIVSNPHDRSHLSIIVRKVAQSRGGSAFMHTEVRTGDVLASNPPANLFPIAKTARRHVMVSGGIGVTPFLSYIRAFQSSGAPWELHHFCREDEGALFERLLAPYGGGRIHVHAGQDLSILDASLRSQALGSHLYTCGPGPMMDAVLEKAAGAGWPKGKLHSESFGGEAMGGAPFTAVLMRSGIEVEVGPETTLLDALEAAGVDAPCLCRGGACGQCETAVIEGVPEHRDHYLNEAERASNTSIMTCVSRSKTQRILLDL
ncbi:PDR/VanB family oxidoreductase [Chthonobacter rhizosphaerae]|uniref:PDR/VanB family oxidoreductase n=1 Tax=Chthonobacter rhizosphaerae TaxID=2735553 RepID=UPI0015EF285D|nr:PDR/VanB family oxidoreductase [Chthonobacter rhizosphaerae]